MARVTILGGSGTFGSRICHALAPHASVRVAARSAARGQPLATAVGGSFQPCDRADPAQLAAAIEGSALVIDASGPFQGADHAVARAALGAGAHYLDIADARAFVAGCEAVDPAARQAGRCAVFGCSSAPAVSDAMTARLAAGLARIDELLVMLSPGNRNPRGASTVGAILSYLGRPVRVWVDGAWQTRRGWGPGERYELPPPVGTRRLHDCDAPDLALLPGRWGASTVRFLAGLELPLLDGALSLLSLLRLPGVARLAGPFERLARLTRWWGTDQGALAVRVRGQTPGGAPVSRALALLAGPESPALVTAPAVILARRILADGAPPAGARPCLGLVSLEELLAELGPLGVQLWQAVEGQWRREEVE